MHVLVQCREDILDVLLETVAVLAGGVTASTVFFAALSVALGDPAERLQERINYGIAVGGMLSAVPSLGVFILRLASVV